MGMDWLTVPLSKRQLKCWHWRYSFSPMNPVRGCAHPSPSTCNMYKKDDSNGINSVRKNESENSEHEFLNFKEPKNRFQGTNFARLCSLAGRYDNPIPTQFLAPKGCLKIPAREK
jgi:hypothetical protein